MMCSGNYQTGVSKVLCFLEGKAGKYRFPTCCQISHLNFISLVATLFLFWQANIGYGQIHGRFLKSPPFDPFPNTTLEEYGNANPVQFDRDVADPQSGLDVGEIKFDYDTFDAETNTLGGGALGGGFFQDAGVRVKNGYSLAWVQALTASTTGANFWNLPDANAGKFPDANTATPRYPFEALDVVPVNGAPTLSYTDDPLRVFADGDATWNGELGLVAIANHPNLEMNGMAFREVRIVGTFLWGFDIDIAPGGAPYDVADDVMADNPSFWGPATNSYVTTFNEFYDGSGGGGGTANGGAAVASTKYKFVTGEMVFVAIPEPSTYILILLGVALTTLSSRKK